MRGTGGAEDWRVRVGDYRILYRVDDEAKEVLVLEVGHRGSVYG
jgi:mRNA interferase RelE/StbE